MFWRLQQWPKAHHCKFCIEFQPKSFFISKRLPGAIGPNYSKSTDLKNGQPSNKHTRLIEGYSAWTEEVTWYVTCWYYRSLALQKSCAFGEILKRCSIDSTPQIELSCTRATCRGHGVRSRAEFTCRGCVQGICRSDLHLRMGGGFNSANSFKVKRRCQLVVRLKANKYY